jgi:hypothetical protein
MPYESMMGLGSFFSCVMKASSDHALAMIFDQACDTSCTVNSYWRCGGERV